MAHEVAKPTSTSVPKQLAPTGTGAGPTVDLQVIPAHPVLQLQRLAGNRAVARALGRDRRVPPRPARPTRLPVISLSLVQRQPDNLMTAEELEKQGGKPKNKKGGASDLLYSKVLQGLGSIGSMKEKRGSAYVNQIEELQANARAWRKKNPIQNFLSKFFLGSFGKARGLRTLRTQLKSPKMQAKLREEKFWAAINSPQARAKQEELQNVLPTIENVMKTSGVEATFAGGANRVSKVRMPPSKTTGAQNQTQGKYYAHRYNPKALPNTELSKQMEKDYNRSTYLPLLARGLGINTVAQAVAGKGGRGMPVSTMEFVEGNTLASLLKDTEEFSKQSKGLTTKDLLPDISDEDLQQNMLFDMVFEAGDAHFGNYMLEGDQPGKKRLKRVDVDTVFGTANPYFRTKPKDATDYSSTARAGSALAGLPQAHRPLTKGILKKIADWNPEKMRTAMENAVGNEGKYVFSKEEIEKVVTNIQSIQQLVSGDNRLSARELFNAYNLQKDPKFNQSIQMLDTKFGSQAQKENIVLTPAHRYLFYNTGLVPRHGSMEAYSYLSHLTEPEKREATHARYRRKPAPKPPPNKAQKSGTKGNLHKQL